MKRLVLMIPFLVLGGCGDGIAWPHDDSDYAVVVAGRVTRDGDRISGYLNGVYVAHRMTEDDCFPSAYQPGSIICRPWDEDWLDYQGNYLIGVPLHREPEEGASWCGTRVWAVASQGSDANTRWDTLETRLSAATAQGGDCSGKRHVIDFDFPP